MREKKTEGNAIRASLSLSCAREVKCMLRRVRHTRQASGTTAGEAHSCWTAGPISGSQLHSNASTRRAR